MGDLPPCLAAAMFSEARSAAPVSGPSGRLFAASTLACVALFVAALVAIIAADVSYTDAASLAVVLRSPEVRSALWLSLASSLATTAIGLALAVPMGYALSRYRFPGHSVVDSLVDLPIILPPLIVGLSLLVFFQTPLGRWIEGTGLRFVFDRRGIVLCQLLSSASFGIRALKLTFDGIDPRLEHVALTLGATPAGAFFRVALPMAARGAVVGAILIWTRAFGLFGPLIVFVGAVPFRTEVLPTRIYLEQSIGRLEVSLALALVMMALATAALVVVRLVGLRQS